VLVSSPVKAAAKKKRDEKEGKGKTKRERKVEGKEPSPAPNFSLRPLVVSFISAFSIAARSFSAPPFMRGLVRFSRSAAHLS